MHLDIQALLFREVMPHSPLEVHGHGSSVHDIISEPLGSTRELSKELEASHRPVVYLPSRIYAYRAPGR